MIPLNFQRIQADYYTGNHHKWLCAPKASGFLYVDPRWQEEVRPTTVSHAPNRPRAGRSSFLTAFDWCGTYDPTPLLSVPAAIDFLDSLSPDGLPGLMSSNRNTALESRAVLLDALGVKAPSPESMIGSLVAIPLPTPSDVASDSDTDRDPDVSSLQQTLRGTYGIEVPVFPSVDGHGLTIRISLQAYNDADQVRQLASALQSLLHLTPSDAIPLTGPTNSPLS